MKSNINQSDIAKKLGISKSYLSMILSGKRKCPEKFQFTIEVFTNVHSQKLKPAWKAGTLPTELLPHAKQSYFSLTGYACQNSLTLWPDVMAKVRISVL